MGEREEWRPIEGFEGYEVSNLGRVRSWWKGGGRRLGKETPVLKEPIIRNARVYKSGYCYVSMYKRCGTRKHRTVHRLVALAFLPKIKSKAQVNHINGIKTDNCVSNLEWVNQSENTNHAYSRGLIKKVTGERHRLSKITNEQAVEIMQSKEPHRVMAQKYGISISTVGRIKNKQWGDLWK